MMKRVVERVLCRRGITSAQVFNRMTDARHQMHYSSMMTMRSPTFFMQPAMHFSTNNSGSGAGGDQPSYIKVMKTGRDWQDAVENTERPVVIQAGASWCGPCNILKPMLIDAVKAQGGKVEYLYVDVDEQKSIAQMLQVSIFKATQ